MSEDACGYGTTGPDDPVSLTCDYSGMYETHHCTGTWGADTHAALDKARSVPELARIWAGLEKAGHVDAHGGAEWHHALSHLRWNLERAGR